MNGSKRSDGCFLVSCFMLGESSFGLDARQVQEIVKVGELTLVRGAPADVVGIRNLRGRIVTVIDMAACLGLGEVDAQGPDVRLLIIENRGETYGFMVDSATDAVELEESRITAPPANMDQSLCERLLGVWRGKDCLSALIDPDKLFNFDDPRGMKL